MDESLLETNDIPSRLVHISVQLFSSSVIVEYAMEKCRLIEVILSCIWHMFVPSSELDRQDDEIDDDDDDEKILKAHPLARMYQRNSSFVTNKRRLFERTDAVEYLLIIFIDCCSCSSIKSPIRKILLDIFGNFC